MKSNAHFTRTAAVVVLAVLSFTSACGADEGTGTEPLPAVSDSSAPVNPPTTPAATPSVGTTIGETGGELSQEALESRLGQEITVVGEVATILGPNAFTLGGDEIGENPILVVSATAPEVEEGDSVRVAGLVVRFSVPDVEEDLDIDIVDNEFEDFDGDPVLTATSAAMM